MNLRERERIDCSMCLYFKGCEKYKYCKLAVIGPGGEFPPPSIRDISMDHVIREILIPTSEYVLSSLDLPV